MFPVISPTISLISKIHLLYLGDKPPYMKIEIRKLKPFKGARALIYSVIIENESKTCFELFYEKYQTLYRPELENIRNKLQVMNHRTGTQEYFFKANEGKPGDGVVALYDSPRKRLRLYCIRYGNATVVLGGGGPKSSSIRAYQEDALLNEEANRMQQVSRLIYRAMREGELVLDEYGCFKGHLILKEYEQDDII